MTDDRPTPADTTRDPVALVLAVLEEDHEAQDAIMAAYTDASLLRGLVFEVAVLIAAELAADARDPESVRAAAAMLRRSLTET